MAETTSRILLFGLLAGVSPIAIVSTLACSRADEDGRTGSSSSPGSCSARRPRSWPRTSSARRRRPTGRRTSTWRPPSSCLRGGLLAFAWPQRRYGRAEAAGGLLGPRRSSAGWASSRYRLHLRRPARRRRREAAHGHDRRRGNGRHRQSLPAEEVARLLYLLVGGCSSGSPSASTSLPVPARTSGWRAAEEWLTTNERRLGFFSTLVFGLLLTSDALYRLL